MEKNEILFVIHSFTDMEKLREDCWMGIPHKLRPMAWRLLSVGFLLIFDKWSHFMIFKNSQF